MPVPQPGCQPASRHARPARAGTHAHAPPAAQAVRTPYSNLLLFLFYTGENSVKPDLRLKSAEYWMAGKSASLRANFFVLLISYFHVQSVVDEIAAKFSLDKLGN